MCLSLYLSLIIPILWDKIGLLRRNPLVTLSQFADTRSVDQDRILLKRNVLVRLFQFGNTRSVDQGRIAKT